MQSATAALSPEGEAPTLDILGEIATEAQRATLESGAVQRSLSAWRECMAADGFEVEMPESQNETSRIDGPSVSRALRDVDCKEASGLIDEYVTALYSEESRLIRQRADELAAYRSFVDARIARAREIVAGIPRGEE
ncbi:hypothetical protein C3481_06435 [Microbacterium sp. Ru50]|nr:hypothetical protein C3481_06435 [Microbacterium sp. Ru50]